MSDGRSILPDAIIAPARREDSTKRLWGDVFDRHGHPQIALRRHARPWSYAEDVCAPDAVRHHVDTAIFAGHLHKHYGHFLIETLPSAIVAARIRAEMPGLKIVFQRFAPEPRAPFYRSEGYRQILLRDAFGIDAQDILLFDDPVRVRDLHIFPRTVQLKGQICRTDVHTEFLAGRDRLLQTYGEMADVPPGDIVYLSRRTRHAAQPGRRKGSHVLGEAEFEAALSAMGVTVIIPETLSISRQLAHYARAKILIGITGSGLHNVLWCAPGTHMIEIAARHKVNPLMGFIAGVAHAHSHRIAFEDAAVKHPQPEGDWLPAFDVDRAVGALEPLLKHCLASG